MALPGANPFAVQREQAATRIKANAQGGQEALKRRFAAAGNLNSGAAVKAQQMAENEANRQIEDANKSIDVNEAQQNYQQGEAQKQRDFQAGQANIDRGFQEKVFNFDSKSKLRQLDLADKDFELRKDESKFNKMVAQDQMNKTGGLFGGGGFLGLGF